MLKENKTLQYLLIVVSLFFLGIGSIIQQSTINTEKKIHLELTEKFKELCAINQQNLTEFDTLFLTAEYQNVVLFNDIKNLEDYLKVSRIGRGKPISRKVKMDVWELVGKYNRKKKEEN